MPRFICLLAPDLHLDNPVSAVSTPRDIKEGGGRLALLHPRHNDHLVSVRGPVAQLPARQKESQSFIQQRQQQQRAEEEGLEQGLAAKKARYSSISSSQHFYLVLMGLIFGWVSLFLWAQSALPLSMLDLCTTMQFLTTWQLNWWKPDGFPDENYSFWWVAAYTSTHCRAGVAVPLWQCQLSPRAVGNTESITNTWVLQHMRNQPHASLCSALDTYVPRQG